MKRKFPMALVVLSVALAAVAGIAVRAQMKSEGYRARLKEVYDGAVLSALRQMEDIELMLNKALVSADPQAESRYLGQAGAGAAQVQRSLSLLPLSHAATQGAVKFANQLEDYTNALLSGGPLGEGDVSRLTALTAACRLSAQALLKEGDSLSDQAVQGGDGFYAAADPEAPAYDSGVSYPVLIYDGPFSDGREAGPALGLGAKTVTQEEALGIARDFVGADRVQAVSYGAEMGGAIPCWGVTLTLPDLTIQAAVTKTGGKILWMAPDAGGFSPEKSLEECRESARLFLEARGFSGMESTYFQVYQGVAVISFAATQGSTLLYPDLIKVQLRMDTAQVVGIEARNYWQNHTARGLLTPALTAEEAGKKAASRLTLQGQPRLCLIPTDGGERLCWEFQGQFEEKTYLIYISAQDGRQEQLLQVVEGAEGLSTL